MAPKDSYPGCRGFRQWRSIYVATQTFNGHYNMSATKPINALHVAHSGVTESRELEIRYVRQRFMKLKELRSALDSPSNTENDYLSSRNVG